MHVFHFNLDLTGSQAILIICGMPATYVRFLFSNQSLLILKFLKF